MNLDDYKSARTIGEVARMVARRNNICVVKMIEYNREPKYLNARKIAIYVAYKLRLGDKADIARFFCRDHSTISSAIRSIQRRFSDDRKSDMPPEEMNKRIFAVLQNGPMFASEVSERIGHGVTVHQVGCRMRSLRHEGRIDSKLHAQATEWGLPGAFDEPEPETPDEPEDEPQSAAYRLWRGVSLPIEPWAEAAQ